MSVDPSRLDLTMVVDANERYCPIGASTIPVENTAETVLYRREPASSKSTETVSFTLDLNDNFLGRDVYISWDKIPIKVTRTTAVSGTAPTAADFHSKFFDNYNSVTLSQFGLLNAINTIMINLDGKPIQTMNTSQIMEQLCHYYSPEELARYMDCSNHNIYYSNLVPAADPWIPSVTTGGEQCLIKGSSLSENDPFSATVSDSFNSRVPLITLANSSTISPSVSATEMTGFLHGLSTWLPFNLLGISGDSSPIYHANKMTITVNFHQNWLNRVFQVKRNVYGGSGEVVSPFKFEFDKSGSGTNSWGDIVCNFKLYRAPQYIRKDMDAAKDRYIQSYSHIEQDIRVQDIKFGPTDTTAKISSTPFDLKAIPKSIVLSVVNKRSQDVDFLTDPVHFARLDDLTVELCGVRTEVATGNGSEQLYHIAKANGLELNKQQALYTLGFPLVLNTSDNLGCASNSYVGLSTATSSGKYTLRIQATATRLQHDTEAVNFTNTGDGTGRFLRREKFYELRVVIIYAGFFTYNMLGSRFNIIESLSSNELESLKQHTNMLFQPFAPKMNILGGSWISSLVPMIKKFAKGAYNVVKDVITNKDNLRDNLLKSYKGAAEGGAPFDGHMPLGGGPGMPSMMSTNISGGRAISGWDGI